MLDFLRICSYDNAMTYFLFLATLFSLTFALLGAWMPWYWALSINVVDWILALLIFIVWIKQGHPTLHCIPRTVHSPFDRHKSDPPMAA